MWYPSHMINQCLLLLLLICLRFFFFKFFKSLSHDKHEGARVRVVPRRNVCLLSLTTRSALRSEEDKRREGKRRWLYLYVCLFEWINFGPMDRIVGRLVVVIATRTSYRRCFQGPAGALSRYRNVWEPVVYWKKFGEESSSLEKLSLFWL